MSCTVRDHRQHSRDHRPLCGTWPDPPNFKAAKHPPARETACPMSARAFRLLPYRAMKSRTALQDRRYLLPLAVIVSTAAGCDAPSPDELQHRETNMSDVAALVSPVRFIHDDWEQEPETVFVSRTVRGPEGDVLESEVSGELTLEQLDRVARPYRYFDEEYIYLEESWERQDEASGNVEEGYRVSRIVNPTPISQTPDPITPPKISPNVLDYVDQAASKEMLTLDLKVRGLPEWNIPLRPDPSFLTPEDVATQLERRETALEDRSLAFDQLAEPIIATIETAGGEVLRGLPKIGWLHVRVPAESFEQLAKLTSLARIDAQHGRVLRSEGRLIGENRKNKFIGWNRHWAAGFTGEKPNAARHSYNDITIGIGEQFGFDEDVCAFRDWAPCSSSPSRVKEIFRCNNSPSNPCSPGSITTSSLGHGTLVASAALGDYRDGQGNGLEMGDPAWANDTCTSSSQCNGESCFGGRCTHSEGWENDRTGAAPEASAVFFAQLGTDQNNYVDFFDDSIDRGLDIVNGSWSFTSNICDIESSTPLEDEVEAAFDDGIFVVLSAGNRNGDNASSCNVPTPQDTPKAFIVNAYDADPGNCSTYPNTRCLLDRNSCSGGDGCSVRGGAPALMPSGLTTNTAVSAVDLVAPTNLDGLTLPGGVGNPNAIHISGTSHAAPVVAGSAALVKDKFLSRGKAWINSPGRLFTVMLHMGDRHYSTNPASGNTWTSQLTNRADDWYGFGRIRLRLHGSGGGLEPRGSNMSTFSVSGCSQPCGSGGGYIYEPFGTSPLPSGALNLKCVMMGLEDMSSKPEISETRLRMDIYSSGTCGSGSPTTITSNDHDIKKVTAYESSALAGSCVRVRAEVERASSEGLTAAVMCRYTGVSDDAKP